MTHCAESSRSGAHGTSSIPHDITCQGFAANRHLVSSRGSTSMHSDCTNTDTVGLSDASPGQSRSRSHGPAATLPINVAAPAEAELEAGTAVRPVATADAADTNDNSSQPFPTEDAASVGQSDLTWDSSASSRASSKASS